MTPSSKSKTKPKPSRGAPNSWEFEAIGTHWWIGIFEDSGREKLSAIQSKVRNRIEEFDKTYSRFRDDSLVTQIAKQAGTYTFPADFQPLITFYELLYEATDGLVTPLIGNVLADAGYDATYSLHAKELRQPPTWSEALLYQDGVLSVKIPALLDFGAAGKGYLVDIIAELLKGEGIDDFCVDAGGDMRVFGRRIMRIGLEHPDDPSQVVGLAKLHNRALAGSARNRRTWAGYHHIMDPYTLHATKGLKAAWVVADSGLQSDGLATALFFVVPEKLNQFDFEYLLVNDRGYYRHSAGFPAELF